LAADALPRVLYSFPHVLGRAGIAETALQQICGLARRGVAVTLFCASAGDVELPPTVTVHETMSLLGRRIPHRAIGIDNAYAHHDRTVARWLRHHRHDVDLAHVWPRACLRTLEVAQRLDLVALRESPNPHTASVIRASARAAESIGVPLPAHHSHAESRRVLDRERNEYDAATAVLVPSPYAWDEFVAEGFSPARMLRHRYGCDLSRFSARADDVPPERPFRAAFVGRGDPTKGLHIGLRAWGLAAIEGGEFHIAGRMQPDYRQRLVRELAQPGVRELGFVRDIPALLRSADVLILPSWTEGSALVVFEAQASGCLPLVSVASGAIGQDGVDFLSHEVGDAQALAAQLRTLAADRARLRGMSERLTAARPQLSWAAAADSLLACYAEALTGAVRR
jgi:glycosyltransferase involved in cell wall biosynthesis